MPLDISAISEEVTLSSSEHAGRLGLRDQGSASPMRATISGAFAEVQARRTYRVAALAFDGNHQHALSIRDDFFSELCGRRAQIWTANDTQLDLPIDDQSETDGVLLFPDEPGRPVN